MKINKLFLLFFIGLLYFIKSSPGQSYEGNKPFGYKHAVGLAAGFTTGIGLSYRYIPSRFSYQLTGMPYTDESIKLYSFGITIMYSLSEGEIIHNFFLYQGNHFWYLEEINDNIVKQWNNGIGFGGEVFTWGRFCSSLMIGYASYNSFKRFSLTAEWAMYYLL